MSTRSLKWPGAGLRIVAMVGAAVLVLAGCGGDGGSDSEGESAAGPLRFANSWAITSLDPVSEARYGTGYGYVELLLRPTPTGVPEPWVLESTEATSDTEWELTLHEGVTFQNGNPADGEALAALINFHLAKNPIVQPMLPGAVAEATGPTTVTLTTKSPHSFVPELLANEAMFPVFDVEAYKALPSGEEQALVGAGIFTGPYEVTELTSDHLVAERNNDYWQGTPALPGVELKFITDAQARVLAVQSGEVDIALSPPTEAARTLESSSTAHFLTAEYGTGGPRVLFNLKKSPVTDVLVRRALSAAVDYEAIANEVMDGHFDVAEGMFPMQLPFAVPNQVHDSEQAEDLLDQAGWVDSGDGVRTKDGQPLELTLATYRTDPDLQSIAVALRSQLEEVGIALEIREIESSSELFEEDLDWHLGMIITGYFAYEGDGFTVQRYMTSEAFFNPGGISDPKIDALADQMSQTFDQERRYDLLREVQDIMIAEKAYTIVPAEKRWPVVVSDTWTDYEPPVNWLFVDWQTTP